MEAKWKALILELFEAGISLAGITSILYLRGFKGLRYLALRKQIFKELQRFDSFRKKGYMDEKET